MVENKSATELQEELEEILKDSSYVFYEDTTDIWNWIKENFVLRKEVEKMKGLFVILLANHGAMTLDESLKEVDKLLNNQEQ